VKIHEANDLVLLVELLLHAPNNSACASHWTILAGGKLPFGILIGHL